RARARVAAAPVLAAGAAARPRGGLAPNAAANASATRGGARSRRPRRMALRTVKNAYGDLSVVDELPTDAAAFQQAMRGVLAAGDRGVWLRVPWSTHAHLLPVAASLGFTPHHTHRDVVTLQAWLPAKANPTPAYCHHAAGAG